MKNNWISEANFYHIYPLGFVGAPQHNEGEKTAGNRIKKVTEWIPHMKELGINSLYLGPIFQSIAHGYDTSDYYRIDTRLGTNEDFKQVCKELKQNGIRIILDGVFNHVGRGFWAFNEVQNKLEQSEYKDWFHILEFGKKNAVGDDFIYETWEGYYDLVKLNLKNPQVCTHLLEAVGMWIDEFDIDGIRLDAADCVDKEFFEKLREYTNKKKVDFWLMGEIIHGDYRTWANPKMLDSTTNYECYKGIYSSHNDKNYFEIAYSLKRQFGDDGIYKDLILYNFLDNHDVNRIGSTLLDKRDLKNVYTLLYMMPGVPSIYYGSEWGIEGIRVDGSDAGIRPELSLYEDGKNNDDALIEHIKILADVRRGSDAIKYGTYKEIMVKNEQFAFARVLKDETKIVILNVSDKESDIDFNYLDKHHCITLKPHSSCIQSETGEVYE